MDKFKGYQMAHHIKPSASNWLRTLIEENFIDLFTSEFQIYKAFYKFIEKKFIPIQYDFKRGFADGGNKNFNSLFTVVVNTDTQDGKSGFCTVIYERAVYCCKRRKKDMGFVDMMNADANYKCVYECGYVYYRNIKHIPLGMPVEARNEFVKEFFKEVTTEELKIKKLINERGK